MNETDKKLCRDCVSSAEKTDRGNLFFKNLAADLAARTSIEPSAEIFFSNLADALNSSSQYGGSHRIIAGAADDNDLEFKGPKTGQNFGLLTTTVSFQTLIDYYIDPSLAPIPLGMTTAEAAEFVGADSIPSVLFSGCRIRGGKEMVWLAPLSDITSFFSPSEPSADELRSFLGLAHFIADEVLVTFEFDKRTAAISELHRPTSFDGGPNMIFRTDLTKRKYGYSVNLVGVAPGAREIISGPIDLNRAEHCKIVGQIRTMPKIEWKKIAGSCQGDISLIYKFLE